MSYDQNGKYVALVDGPLANLSEGIYVLSTIWLHGFALFVKSSGGKISHNWALALYCHAKTQQFGALAALLWAQHINISFRCAVSKDTIRLAGTDTDLSVFSIAAVAVSEVGSCQAHELFAVLLLLALAFSLKRMFRRVGPSKNSNKL